MIRRVCTICRCQCCFCLCRCSLGTIFASIFGNVSLWSSSSPLSWFLDVPASERARCGTDAWDTDLTFDRKGAKPFLLFLPFCLFWLLLSKKNWISAKFPFLQPTSMFTCKQWNRIYYFHLFFFTIFRLPPKSLTTRPQSWCWKAVTFTGVTKGPCEML